MRFAPLFISILSIFFLTDCQKKKSADTTEVDAGKTGPVAEDKSSTLIIPKTDADNGGLFLPDGFGALVVADSVGPTRHLAVNDNGDIYVKLRIAKGDAGNVALRDTNKDGKVDIYQRFGDYPN